MRIDATSRPLKLDLPPDPMQPEVKAGVEAPQDEEVKAALEADPGRPGRSHIQQELHHLDREIRHAMRREMFELRETGEWSPDHARSIRELSKGFREDLKASFHDAGKGNEFDASSIPDDVALAMSRLTEGLRQLREGEEAGTHLDLTA